MTDYVRIKDPGTGDEFTYDTAKVEALGLQDYVIDKNPFGPDGRPAEPKPRLPLGVPREGSAAERRRNKTSGAQGSGEDAGQTSATSEKEN